MASLPTCLIIHWESHAVWGIKMMNNVWRLKCQQYIFESFFFNKSTYPIISIRLKWLCSVRHTYTACYKCFFLLREIITTSIHWSRAFNLISLLSLFLFPSLLICCRLLCSQAVGCSTHMLIYYEISDICWNQTFGTTKYLNNTHSLKCHSVLVITISL